MRTGSHMIARRCNLRTSSSAVSSAVTPWQTSPAAAQSADRIRLRNVYSSADFSSSVAASRKNIFGNSVNLFPVFANLII